MKTQIRWIDQPAGDLNAAVRKYIIKDDCKHQETYTTGDFRLRCSTCWKFLKAYSSDIEAAIDVMKVLWEAMRVTFEIKIFGPWAVQVQAWPWSQPDKRVSVDTSMDDLARAICATALDALQDMAENA